MIGGLVQAKGVYLAVTSIDDWYRACHLAFSRNAFQCLCKPNGAGLDLKEYTLNMEVSDIPKWTVVLDEPLFGTVLDYYNTTHNALE